MKPIKKFLLVVLFSVSSVRLLAQVPQAFNYQAIARDASGKILSSQNINVRISIIDSSNNGQAVYVELQKTSTNQFGLFTTAIGTGTGVNGNFDSIPWATGNKWMRVEMDLLGGNDFVLISQSQLQSVPYALYATNSGNGGIPGVTGPIGNTGLTGATGSIGVTGVTGATGTVDTLALNNFWKLKGNLSTNVDSNFIGTTDTVDLSFRTNNIPTMLLKQNGSLFLFNQNQNTFIGDSVGQASLGALNTFLGWNAGFTIITDSFIHYQAGSSDGNTAIGAQTLSYNTSGSVNTAIGYYALNYNTTGFNNTAVGQGALQFNTTGYYNTCIGAALVFNTTGSNNVAAGVDALEFNSTGSFNTGMGSLALASNESGSKNSAYGYLADVSPIDTNLTNATALGSNAIVNASNKVRIGDVDVKVVESAAGSWTTSDGRFKTNISEEVKGLEFINKLHPVVYNFDTRKFQEFLTQNMVDSIKRKHMDMDFSASTAIRQSGFIAQEVEEAAKECGYNFNGVHHPDNEGDNYSLSYEKFVVPLVKGMQEEDNRIEKLNKIIFQQQQQITELMNLLEEFKKQ